MTQIYTKNVGLFLVLPAPLNPIGAFDAERFKSNFRTIMGYDAGFKFVAVDLSGLDFVYSDAYNAFMQCHQELSNKNGAFAVLADKDSLANNLRKVGLERFIRIFMSEAEMTAFTPIESPKEAAPSATTPAAANAPKKDPPTARVAVVEKIDPSAYETPVEKPAPEEPKVLDKNPLEDDEPSSKSMVFVVVVLLLIAVAAAAYYLM
jgi:anti-anti-sigma regulatory factor